MTTKRIDTSWIIYALQQEQDVTSFRCDVFSEVLQWNTSDSSKSLYFVSSLHDLWSKSFSKQSDPGVSRKLQEEEEEVDSYEEELEEKKDGEWFTMLSTNNQWIRILDDSTDYIVRLDDFQ